MKNSYQETSEELLTRLVHRMGRSLGAFRSTAQALLNGADEDPMLRRELLQDMETELGELQRLLENVTQFEAIQRGTFYLNRKPVSPTPWLRQLITRWQRIARDKTLLWVVSVPDGLPPVDADMEKLEQGISNLLSNAIRHSSVGARITFSAEGDRDALTIKITSAKPRLESDEYDKLFDLFFTGDAQGRFPVGTGLGLHVTRQLVEQHGGRIALVPPHDDNDAIGFEISLPVSANSYSSSPRVRA